MKEKKVFEKLIQKFTMLKVQGNLYRKYQRLLLPL